MSINEEKYVPDEPDVYVLIDQSEEDETSTSCFETIVDDPDDPHARTCIEVACQQTAMCGFFMIIFGVLWLALRLPI
jgi:hypothetical protein